MLGSDCIHLQIIKTAANLIDSNLYQKKNKKSGDAKTALVRHLYETVDTDKIKNY